MQFGRLGRGFGRLGAPTKGSSVSLTTIPDTATPPDNQYKSGSYLAIQAVNDFVSTRSQSMTINPATFPNGTRFDWSWPVVADPSVKSYNAIDYGNYLVTDVTTPIASSKISDLTTLKSAHNFTYGGYADGSNVTLDGFLYTTQGSETYWMSCEWQVFFHLSVDSKAFIDGETSLGTYTSAAIDGTPAIAWKAARQGVNFFGTAYYLFYPIDVLEKPVATFDIKAMFDWLSGVNPTTGLTYLTGNERYNGHSFGAEAIENAASTVVNTLATTYAFNTPTVSSATPAQPNLYSTTNLLNGAWVVDGGFTKIGDGSGVTDVNGYSGTHSLYQTVTVSANTAYHWQVDVDTANGWPNVMLQVFRQDFGAVAQVFYDIATRTVFGLTNSGFTSVTIDIQRLDNGKTRLYLNFTTDASTTSLWPFIKAAKRPFADSYVGVTGKNLLVSNPWIYA